MFRKVFIWVMPNQNYHTFKKDDWIVTQYKMHKSGVMVYEKLKLLTTIPETVLEKHDQENIE